MPTHTEYYSHKDIQIRAKTKRLWNNLSGRTLAMINAFYQGQVQRRQCFMLHGEPGISSKTSTRKHSEKKLSQPKVYSWSLLNRYPLAKSLGWCASIAAHWHQVYLMQSRPFLEENKIKQKQKENNNYKKQSCWLLPSTSVLISHQWDQFLGEKMPFPCKQFSRGNLWDSL